MEAAADPEPQSGQVLLEVAANGICGSDLTIWNKGKPEPVILGHEIAARVLSGPDAGRWAAVNQGAHCGACARCAAGLDHFCQQAEGLGAVRFGGTIGGLGQFVVAAEDRVILAPDGMDPALIALSEPLGNAFRTLRPPEVDRASSAVVIGCGPIGLALVAALRARGVEQVVAIEGRPGRADMARRLGATEVLDPGGGEVEHLVSELLPLGADLVLEAAGKVETVEQAARFARPGGSLFLQGIPLEAVRVPLWSWIGKELTIRTSVGLSVEEHRQALHTIAEAGSTVPFADMVTRRVSLDDTPALFDDLAAGADEIKAVVLHDGVQHDC